MMLFKYFIAYFVICRAKKAWLGSEIDSSKLFHDIVRSSDDPIDIRYG